MILLDSTVLAATGGTAAWMLFLRALLRNPRNNAVLCAWLCALFLAFGLYLGLLEYGAHATHPFPLWARISAITQHVCTLAGLYAGYCAYAHLVHGPREAVHHVLRQARVLAVTLTIMLVPAVLAGPDDFSAAHMGHYGEGPVAGSYLAVFTVYAGIITGALAKTSWTWARRVDDRWIRRGLLAGTAGLLTGVVYFLLRAGYTALAITGHQPSAKEGSLVGWLLAVSVPLSLAGLTAPGWGPRLSRARAWWWAYRAHRRLHPLWAELTGAFPHVRLTLPASRFRHLDLRLHLRVVQIWDARRALLGHCRAADYRRALSESKATGRQRAAQAEAAMLAAGLHRLRTGQAPGEPGETHAEPHTREADLPADVAWLVQVAAALPRQRTG